MYDFLTMLSTAGCVSMCFLIGGLIANRAERRNVIKRKADR